MFSGLLSSLSEVARLEMFQNSPNQAKCELCKSRSRRNFLGLRNATIPKCESCKSDLDQLLKGPIPSAPHQNWIDSPPSYEEVSKQKLLGNNHRDSKTFEIRTFTSTNIALGEKLRISPCQAIFDISILLSFFLYLDS